jgi:hypothetical protein
VRQNDTLFIVLGAFYLVVGMLLGIVMGIRQDFELAPVHADINLVGFAAHGLSVLSTRPGPTSSKVQWLWFSLGYSWWARRC